MQFPSPLSSSSKWESLDEVKMEETNLLRRINSKKMNIHLWEEMCLIHRMYKHSCQ